MTQNTIPSGQASAMSSGSEHGQAEIALAGLALLSELESSLYATQEALLSRDLARLEQSTREQVPLRRALEILWSGDAATRVAAMPQDPALAAELRSAEIRVLQLGRVQAALLIRAERWLRMVSNLLAGPEANYLPPEANRRVPPSVEWRGRGEKRKDEEGDPCRV